MQVKEYQIKAYAKVNLGLDVVRRLPNGYHQVKMVMQSVGICDELLLEKAERGIVLTADSREVPLDETNLIYRAAKLMQEEYGIGEGIRIHLRKKIPVAAGMAGGSTDAAAAMKGMNQLFGLNVPRERLMELGVAIGADVPYCILGGTALAEGIGEKLTGLRPMPDCFILAAKPEISVSTKYVYEHLDGAGIVHHPDIDGMAEAIEGGNLPGILERMENVLEAVTISAWPVVGMLKERMLALGAERSLMSGSGPTVFGIFTGKEKAEAALEQLGGEHLAKQVFLTMPVGASQD
nr:4-(cytidine 5'-diphospho)-2-C-methyl-D-erythritol kinase [uncultured Acetatifactor sp.]